jgi:hypothetical protein
MCGCTSDNLEVIYRYSTKELHDFEKKIEKACKHKDDY